MCGRFEFSAAESAELMQIIASVQRRHDPSIPNLNFPCGEVLPGVHTPVMIAEGEKIVGDWQKWGMKSWDGKQIINARAETVMERPMFRKGFAEHRCVIPTTGFYEFDEGHRKYYFGEPGQPMYLAGVSDVIEGVSCFVILTTAPNKSMSDIHDRMPLILQREQIRPWLTRPEEAIQILTIIPPLLSRKCMEAQVGIEGFQAEDIELIR